jgi:hypothetical protein
MASFMEPAIDISARTFSSVPQWLKPRDGGRIAPKMGHTPNISMM